MNISNVNFPLYLKKAGLAGRNYSILPKEAFYAVSALRDVSWLSWVITAAMVA